MISGCCSKDYMAILFNSEQINDKTIKTCSRYFKENQRINFVILSQENFSYPIIRLQILKKADNVEFLGYSLISTKDYRVSKNKNFFIDYFVINKKGKYIVQVFYLDNLNYPVIRDQFFVQ